MADLMRLAVSVAVIAGAKEIFCWGKKFVATTTVKDIVDETIEKAPSFFYRSTLRARVRAVDPVRPARRFDTKEEWKTVLDELHKKGKLIYNAEGRDDISLPTATPPAGDAGPL